MSQVPVRSGRVSRYAAWSEVACAVLRHLGQEGHGGAGGRQQEQERSDNTLSGHFSPHPQGLNGSLVLHRSDRAEGAAGGRGGPEVPRERPAAQPERHGEGGRDLLVCSSAAAQPQAEAQVSRSTPDTPV